MLFTEPDWKGQTSSGYGRVHIGDNTVIRELTIINKPTDKVTRIGDECVYSSTFGDRCYVMK